MSINQERRLHFRELVPLKQAWRLKGMAAARQAKVPRLSQAEIHVRVWLSRGILQDAGNAFPTAKSIQDGLVDAGVLPDDGPEYVRYLGFHAPERGEDRVEITIVEVV